MSSKQRKSSKDKPKLAPLLTTSQRRIKTKPSIPNQPRGTPRQQQRQRHHANPPSSPPPLPSPRAANPPHTTVHRTYRSRPWGDNEIDKHAAYTTIKVTNGLTKRVAKNNADTHYVPPNYYSAQNVPIKRPRQPIPAKQDDDLDDTQPIFTPTYASKEKSRKQSHGPLFENDMELADLQAHLEKYRIHHELHQTPSSGGTGNSKTGGGGMRGGPRGNSAFESLPSPPPSSKYRTQKPKYNPNAGISPMIAEEEPYYNSHQDDNNHRQQPPRSRFDRGFVYDQAGELRRNYSPAFDTPLDPMLEHYKTTDREYNLSTLADQRPTLYKEFISADTKNPITLNQGQMEEVETYARFPRYQALLANHHSIITNKYVNNSNASVVDLYHQLQKQDGGMDGEEDAHLPEEIRREKMLDKAKLAEKYGGAGKVPTQTKVSIDNDSFDPTKDALGAKRPSKYGIQIESYDQFREADESISRAGATQSHRQMMDRFIVEPKKNLGSGGGAAGKKGGGGGEGRDGNNRGGTPNTSQSGPSNSSIIEKNKALREELRAKEKNLPNLDDLFTQFDRRMQRTR